MAPVMPGTTISADHNGTVLVPHIKPAKFMSATDKLPAEPCLGHIIGEALELARAERDEALANGATWDAVHAEELARIEAEEHKTIADPDAWTGRVRSEGVRW